MPIKIKKGQSPAIANPADLARRLQFFSQIAGAGQAAPPPSAGVPPILADLPPEIVAFLDDADPAQMAQVLIALFEDLDLCDLTPEQLQLIRAIPQAAGSIFTGKAQARALDVQPDVGTEAGVSGAQLWRGLNLHDEMQGILPGLLAYLDSIGALKELIAGLRAKAQDRGKAFLKEQQAALKPGDPDRARYQAALSMIEAKEQQQQAQDDAERQRLAKDRAAAVATLTRAQSEFKLAEVLSQLGAGQVPDRESLLEAAAQLKQQLREQGQLDDEPATQAQGERPAQKGKGKPAQKPNQRGRARTLH